MIILLHLLSMEVTPWFSAGGWAGVGVQDGGTHMSGTFVRDAWEAGLSWHC